MSVEEAMEDLTERMKQTDRRMDDLAVQVGNIETEMFAPGNGEEIVVNALLKSVGEVKDNYQNLRKDLVEVQDLQRQLSTSLQEQLRLMQTKFSVLKEKVGGVQKLENKAPEHGASFFTK